MIDRGDYWQCGYIIRKGGIEEVRQQGLPAFRDALREIAPFLQDRVNEIADWDQVKLLTVKVDRLRTWYRPGLLCIGDSAHAMSPVGGIGINLAIQDAVATANLLAAPLGSGSVTVEDLRRVQDRRLLPTRLTQWLQVQVQDRVLSPALGRPANSGKPPLPMRIARRFPIVQRIPARIVGLGFRPEHVRVPEARTS
jgi:2-polyprenyl-6-methoxyphenol hydroxylase-like FAD-dependent oxidoreductase